jgi:cell division protein FtsW (lipid II flippase)
MVPRWRGVELYLLVLAGGVLAMAMFSLQQSVPSLRGEALSLSVIFMLLFIGAHAALTVVSPQADQLLLPLTAVLSAIGLVFALRLDNGSAALAHKQLVWLGMGLLLMVVTVASLKRYTVLRDYKYIAAFLGIGLMGVTAVAGREINGSRLWLGAGGFYFQVTEAMKLQLVLFLSG